MNQEREKGQGKAGIWEGGKGGKKKGKCDDIHSVIDTHVKYLHQPFSLVVISQKIVFLLFCKINNQGERQANTVITNLALFPFFEGPSWPFRPLLFKAQSCLYSVILC